MMAYLEVDDDDDDDDDDVSFICLLTKGHTPS
jgi:hypothetical protein